MKVSDKSPTTKESDDHGARAAGSIVRSPGTFCSLLKLSSKETFIIQIVIPVHKVENGRTNSVFYRQKIDR